MKNSLLAGLFGVALSVASCSTVSNAKTAQQNRAEFLKLKGDWEITSVEYDRSLRVKPFDEGADATCFIGSHWRLIPNNYSGAYTLNGASGCPALTQPIKFEMVGGNTFLFKKLIEGSKAKAVTQGYALTLVDQSTDQFSLQQNIPFEGKTVRVVYHFQRTASK
ncbi:hypothetical protein [Bergeyella sp. RCAD1439]|uniref:hypothetical protein n=1 Tax=Bergeyella anatis TaxID=3113737 RepID=UPI002E177384|nr:hypothetical protein [Bergeyella sp. RCAD1439]